MYTTTLTHSRLVQFQMQLHCQKHLKSEKKQDHTQTKLLQIISFVFFLAALIINTFQKGNNWHFCHQEQNFWKNTMKLHLVALKRSISNYSFLNAPVINIVAPMNWHLDLNSPKQNPNTNQASFFTPLKGNWCGKQKNCWTYLFTNYWSYLFFDFWYSQVNKSWFICYCERHYSILFFPIWSDLPGRHKKYTFFIHIA